MKLLPGSSFAQAVAQWAMLERQIEAVLWIMLGTKLEIAVCVTKEIQSIRTKIIILEGILEYRKVETAQLKRLRAFRNSLEGLTRRRNRLVHDPHKVSDKGILVYPGAEDPSAGILMSNDDLKSFVDECYYKTSEFKTITEQMFKALGIPS